MSVDDHQKPQTFAHLWTAESKVHVGRGRQRYRWRTQGWGDDGVGRGQAVHWRAQGGHGGRQGPGCADHWRVAHHATHRRGVGVGRAHRPCRVCGGEGVCCVRKNENHMQSSTTNPIFALLLMFFGGFWYRFKEVIFESVMVLDCIILTGFSNISSNHIYIHTAREKEH